MTIKHKFLLAAALIGIGTLSAGARQGAPMVDPNVNALKDYCSPANTPERAEISFMPDGTQYAVRSDDGRRIVAVDIATGKEGETLFDITHTRENVIDTFDGFTLSPDASKILLWRDTSPVYRRSFTAQYYVYERRSRLLKPLSAAHPKQRDPIFSPDSRMVAFVADNNIYAAKLDYGTEVAVTADGAKDSIINGATDWTYEEEFSVTALMSWSPDNLTLCYVRFDETKVPMYTLPLYQGSCPPLDQYRLYPGSHSYKYPVAGKPNSTVSLHSYDVETRKTKEISFPEGSPDYIPVMSYGPGEAQLIVGALNRDQNRYEIFRINPKSTVVRSIYSRSSQAWIIPEAYERLHIGADGIAVADDSEGYTRWCRYSYSGGTMGAVAVEGADVTDYYGSDAAGNLYFQTASPRPVDRTLHRLDARGRLTALGNDHGTTSAVFAPGMRFYLQTYSDIATPPQISLNRSDGRPLRSVVDNSRYASRTKPLLQNKEFFTFQANGYTFNGYMIRPAAFDSSRRYPVIMSQYSGPGSQQVLDRWTLDWEQYFASQGYIIICVDGRGTGGRGTAFRTCVYRQLGNLETADQISAARYAASLPYVDASAIGIYGWSYGGYQSLMCATDDNAPYAAAIAVAPVTDWRLYDTVYTERYMLTPQQNESGYNSSSVLGRALHLQCPLLLMYGTDDDNVHPANTLELVSALQSFGIMCDMFVFPNRNHSINVCNSRQVVYARMLSYFNDKLKR